MGEVIAYRNLFWSLSEAMARHATPWVNGAVLPNLEAASWYHRALRVVLLMVAGLLALGVPGCAPQLTGNSGALTWEVTDLRIVERSVAGTARNLYTFTLVLQETQGSAVTFTHLEQTVSQPSVKAVGEAQYSAVLWKLRPHGELRQSFSFYWYCT